MLWPDSLCRISWARIYPFGAAGSPLNQEGLDHYSDGMLFYVGSKLYQWHTMNWSHRLSPGLWNRACCHALWVISFLQLLHMCRFYYDTVHWDIPLALIAYYGGFTSSQIVDDFAQLRCYFSFCRLQKNKFIPLFSIQLRQENLPDIRWQSKNLVSHILYRLIMQCLYDMIGSASKVYVQRTARVLRADCWLSFQSVNIPSLSAIS